ncbi:AIR synthase-related protein [Klenkia terrae]|uniref:AIR synthase-related protein n=1 Tax=Klenkia terrae TaxID=1052259 RepID=UPI0036169486
MAVRRGRPRPGRRLPRAGPAGHRRQREPLQPDRRRADQPDPGHRGARGARRRPAARARRLDDGGETLLLLGESRPEFGGSAWASVVHGHLGGLPPRLDLDAERALGGLLASLAADGLVSSAHDLSDGGLAQALTESALRYGVGATVSVDGDPTAALFGESVARAVVTTADAAAVLAAAQAAGVPVTELGTTGGDALVVEGLLELPLDELHTAWSTTLPTLFDTPEAVVGSVPAGAVPTS